MRVARGPWAALGGQSELPPMLLPRLVAWRWGAAVIVFLYHCSLFVDWWPLHWVRLGPSGMTFFFMLSGLVLAWSWQPTHGAFEFYVRRIARIWPTGLVMLGAAAIMAEAFPDLNIMNGVHAFMAQLCLIQAWFPGLRPAFAFDGVSWSLSVELFLYAVFPFLIQPIFVATTAVRMAILSAYVAFGAVVLWALEARYSDPFTTYTNPLLRLPEFVLGVIIAAEIRDGRRLRLHWTLAALIIVGGVGALTLSPITQWSVLSHLVFAGLFALGLMTLASLDADGQRGVLTCNISLYLGSLSFAFYLVHFIVILFVFRELSLGGQKSLTGGTIPVLLAFGMSFAASVLLHHVAEVPLERLFRMHGLAGLAALRRRGLFNRNHGGSTAETVTFSAHTIDRSHLDRIDTGRAGDNLEVGSQ